MINYSKSIADRIRSRLGEPSISVELLDYQMKDLFYIAVKTWNLYSTLSKIEKDKLENIEYEWVEKYFQAICKESLGRIRNKYNEESNIHINDIKLEYQSLLIESKNEQTELIGLLMPTTNKIILAAYINIGNLDESDINKYMGKIRDTMSINKFFELFLVPVRDQETYIECVYPNFVYDEELKNKAKEALLKIIETIK